MTSACFSRGHTGFSRNATLVATVNPPALAGGVFNNFADVQAPVCYSNFFSVAKSCMKSRHREGLRHLLNFKLKKHPRYNLSSKRLKYIEIAVQKRASLLLEGETHSESELIFW